VRILGVITGDYGKRHLDNIRAHGLGEWAVAEWRAPSRFPIVIDYPDEYVPRDLPPADLVLSFAEAAGVAELIPDVVRVTGARAVIAPVDSEAWLPRGLARQLRGWLEDMGVVCVTPKPLCSLTETDYGVARGRRTGYEDPLISEFARRFGRPDLLLTVDPGSRTITAAGVSRDAVCGCARFVAERLVGLSVEDAEHEAGMLHHHYPCLASMGIDSDYGDTLMHVSGNILRDNVARQVRPYRQVRYIAPGKQSE
jgi:hypothetical protein